VAYSFEPSCELLHRQRAGERAVVFRKRKLQQKLRARANPSNKSGGVYFVMSALDSRIELPGRRFARDTFDREAAKFRA
jgi:hypothetical protein